MKNISRNISIFLNEASSFLFQTYLNLSSQNFKNVRIRIPNKLETKITKKTRSFQYLWFLSLILFFRILWNQILGRYVLKLKAPLSSKNYIPVASLRNVSVKAVFKFWLSIRQEVIYQIEKYEIIFDVPRVTEPRVLWDFNQQTEMEQYLKLNMFLDIRTIYTSYVGLVIYLFKFR